MPASSVMSVNRIGPEGRVGDGATGGPCNAMADRFDDNCTCSDDCGCEDRLHPETKTSAAQRPKQQRKYLNADPLTNNSDRIMNVRKRIIRAPPDDERSTPSRRLAP